MNNRVLKLGKASSHRICVILSVVVERMYIYCRDRQTRLKFGQTAKKLAHISVRHTGQHSAHIFITNVFEMTYQHMYMVDLIASV